MVSRSSVMMGVSGGGGGRGDEMSEDNDGIMKAQVHSSGS